MIIQVKDFNKQARAEYDKAVENYEPSEGGFPSLLMHIFSNEAGEPRQKGWVITNGHCHVIYPSKQKAIDFINS